MAVPALLPPDTGLVVTSVAITPELIGIAARCTRPAAPCPCCGALSGHVHSRYVRTIADLPWQGRRVVLRLTARRFRCTTAGCTRAIFCERFPAALAPHARTTGRLTEVHRLIGFALGGEPGARLCRPLAVPTSPDTLLRRVKATPLPERPAPRVLGVDDFAFRRGQNYGTILVDLERRHVIDLLPDRTADTLADWLRRHPGIAVISRDRASAYAQAAQAAAPAATQVADRFHLLANVREAVEQVLARHPAAVRDALTAGRASPPAAPEIAPNPAPAPDPKRQATEGRRQRRLERYEQARRLHQEGVSQRAIARALHMSRGVLRRFLRTGHVPDWKPGRTGPSQLDPFRDQIDRRIGDGCRNAQVLFRELRGLGYAGGYDQVRRALHKRTGADGRRQPRGAVSGPRPLAAPAVEVPSPRRLSFLVLRKVDQRGTDGQNRVEQLREGAAPLGAAVALAEEFAALVRGRSAAGLAEWLARAEASELPEFLTLVRGMQQDEAAVRAGLTEVWSQGQVEGRVGRLKLIKRAMFGRAGFALLKARVLNTG
jgi:transposase